MNGPSLENWENRILSAAHELPYPPTPDIAWRLVQRRSLRSLAYRRAGWAAAILVVLLLATILLVPPVRARHTGFPADRRSKDLPGRADSHIYPHPRSFNPHASADRHEPTTHRYPHSYSHLFGIAARSPG